MIEVGVELLRQREPGKERPVPCLVDQPTRRLLQCPVAPMRPVALLSNRNERVGCCSPQFFGRLKVVSSREFLVRDCEKLAGGP